MTSDAQCTHRHGGLAAAEGWLVIGAVCTPWQRRRMRLEGTHACGVDGVPMSKVGGVVSGVLLKVRLACRQARKALVALKRREWTGRVSQGPKSPFSKASQGAFPPREYHHQFNLHGFILRPRLPLVTLFPSIFKLRFVIWYFVPCMECRVRSKLIYIPTRYLPTQAGPR